MKKYSFIILAILFLALTTLPVFAADSPSAEELAKMNAAVAKITALIADARMAIPLHILAEQLKTSGDPEAIKAGAKIEKMADDMSSSGSGGGASSLLSPHSGSAPLPSGTSFGSSKTTMPAVMSAIPSGTTTFTVPMSSGSYTKAYTGGTKITPATSGVVPVKTGSVKTPSALEAIKDSPTKIFFP